MKTQSEQLEARDILERIRRDPVWYAEECLGFRTWSAQREMAESVRDNARTTIKSGNTVGKTRMAAAVVLWWLSAWEDSIAITTASEARQVKGQLWGEIHDLYQRAIVPVGGRPLTTSIEMGPRWFAQGFTAREQEGFQGWHSSSGRILFVIDEAPAVGQRFWEAIEGSMGSPDARWLAMGNPTSAEGAFFESFRSPLWNGITISCYDTPNVKKGRMVIPGLVSPTWPDERKKEWGEDSPLYKARVLGEFPEQTLDTLMPLAWVEKAIGAEVSEDGEAVVGVDVARFGQDRTVITTRRGERVIGIEAFHGMDTMETVGRAGAQARANKARIVIDETTLGGGPYDRLRELGFEVIGVTFGSNADDVAQFKGIESQLWWGLRERFENTAKGKPGPKISIPNDIELIAELTNRKYKFTSTSQIRIEPKDDPQYKKRVKRSPDKADSLALAFYSPAAVECFVC